MRNFLDKAWIDLAGSCGSALCAVHCLVAILAPSLFVAVGLGGLLSEEAEWILTGTAVLVACVAAYLGHRRHRSWWITSAFVFFMSSLVVSLVLAEVGKTGFWSSLAAVGGGVGLATTHLLNLRRQRTQTPGSPDELADSRRAA